MFKDFYKLIKIFGDKLPKVITEETNVQCCPISGEAKYEIAFLIKWAEKMPINLHQNLTTTFKNQTTNLDSGDELLNKIASSKIYEPLSWIYEKHYKDKKSFPPANIVLTDIKKEFNNNSNHCNDKYFLSDNECQVLHNVMRMVFDLKKSNL